MFSILSMTLPIAPNCSDAYDGGNSKSEFNGFISSAIITSLHFLETCHSSDVRADRVLSQHRFLQVACTRKKNQEILKTSFLYIFLLIDGTF